MHTLIVCSEPYFIPTVPLGGIFQEHQAGALRAAGIKAGIASGGLLPFRDVATFSGRPLLERKKESLIVRRFTKSLVPLRFSSSTWVHRVNRSNLVRSIETYIQHEGAPDFIHAHNLQYAGIAGYEVSKKYGIPLILTEHSSSFLADSFPRELYDSFISVVEHATRNMAVSTTLASELNRVFPTLNNQFTVMPNVIDFNLPSVTVEKNNKFTFLSIGRLDCNKNHKLLIEAFAQSFKDKPISLRIGGVGKEESRLRALAESLLVENQVNFLGFLDREQVARELSSAHCFVLPSFNETFGVVVIEALSKGLPVIATPCGGPLDIVNELNGIIIPDHSVESLAKALIDMHARFHEFNSVQISRDALARFSPESFAREMTEIYRNVLKSKKHM